MKKVLKAAILLFIIIITAITLMPANLFANNVDFGFNQFSDSPNESSFFILWANNCNGLTYEFLITQGTTEIYKENGNINNDQWHKLINLTLTSSSTYDLTLTVNGHEPYTSNLSIINWHGSTELSANAGTSCSNTLFNMGCGYFGPQAVWNFSISEYIGNGDWNPIYSNSGPVESTTFTRSESRLLPEGLYNALFSVYSAHDYEVFLVNSCNESDPAEDLGLEEAETVWVRDREMTCYQAWINEDNNFEFVFWWEYANNNHVHIYDMSGNLVWETDFIKGQAHFTADLPDGFYTVKTFHNGFETPIQEFLIGKP